MISGNFNVFMQLEYLKGKSILITGGTGSFGKKCVQILLEQSEALRIIIFSRDELKQSEMQTHLADYAHRLRFFIGDIRDLERLEMAFKGVDYIIHAAALKQVPALEYNPFEAIKTNILGTQNVISAAISCNVKKVLLISTDKAANPANLYGATKLCAEKLMVSANVYAGASGTKLSIVRYGNVFGSRGSIIQLIEKQRERGEINLTHEDMTRFWITLNQSVDFVLTILEQMGGGEIFIPKIPSMRIRDVLVSLAPGCTIKIIGIRPGEKLHEVLVTPEEALHTQEFDSYYVIFPEYPGWENPGTLTGQAVEKDFYLSSNNNKHWLSKEDLLDLSGS